MTKNNKCVFCEIVKKKLPSNIVFEDKNFLAFLSIGAVSKGHTLLIPKKHFVDVFDFETEYLEKLMGTAQKIAKIIVKENKATGINLLQASGKDAEQSVFHFHLHLVPRYKNDGLKLWYKNKL
ncbi:MAG: HIT domain-containing protein [Candidatus Paceibacterota bacterium]